MYLNKILWIGLLLLVGCTNNAQPTLSGKVIHRDFADLKFHSDSIELQSVSSPQKLAFGGLSETGEFKIESLQEGKIVLGAPAGEYRVRLIVSDDDSGHRNDLLAKIDPKFLSFERSGWTVDVPGREVVLVIASPSK